jgi:hypothetical protein
MDLRSEMVIASVSCGHTLISIIRQLEWMNCFMNKCETLFWFMMISESLYIQPPASFKVSTITNAS